MYGFEVAEQAAIAAGAIVRDTGAASQSTTRTPRDAGDRGRYAGRRASQIIRSARPRLAVEKRDSRRLAAGT
jgi:hypothetical protein